MAEDSEDEPEQLQYKVILLGDGATGKTSIANRFTDDHFAQQYKQTIGVDFFIKRLALPGDVRGHTTHERYSIQRIHSLFFFSSLRRCTSRCKSGTLAASRLGAR